MATVTALLILLIAGHAICDYPLQGDYLAKSKNRNLSGDSAGWRLHLFYHAAIHCGMVFIITHSIAMGLGELVIHGVTDHLKCEKRISGRVDQAIHLASKVVWAVIAWRLQWHGI